MTSSRSGRRTAIAPLSAVFFVILLGLALAPYPWLKAVADRLVADGELESFTPRLARVVQSLAGTIAGLGLLAAAWSFISPETFSRALSAWGHRWLGWRRDLRRFVVDLRLLGLNRLEAAAMTAIIGLGLVARLMQLDRPIEYDEAYTVMAFAHSPFRVLLTDYHVPNNHVFHTILVRFAVLLLGSEPWQVRLPAFLAGILLIPFVFWLGRALYGREAGLLSAAMVAFLPHMIERSVTARGYILVALLSVMAFLLAAYLRRRRNLFGWTLLAIVCALGFYSVPVMFYPFGFLLLWMVMSAPAPDGHPYTRAAWFLHCLAAGAATGVATVVFYLPILLTTGAKTIVANNLVLQSQSLPIFLGSLAGIAADVLEEWTSGLGPVWSGILLLGILLTVPAMRVRRKGHVHTLLAFIPAALVLLLIQRPNALSRIWLWALPFACLWAAAGLSAVLVWAGKNWTAQRISAVLLVGLVAGLATVGLNRSRRTGPAVSDPEAAAIYLAPRLTATSMVVLSYETDAYLWYYLYLHGAVSPLISTPSHWDRPFDEVFVVVFSEAPDCRGGHVLSTLDLLGPDLSLLDLDRETQVGQFGRVKVCLVPTVES